MYRWLNFPQTRSFPRTNSLRQHTANHSQQRQHQPAPPTSSWGPMLHWHRLAMCLTQNSHTMLNLVTHESGNKHLCAQNSFFPSFQYPWIQPPPWWQSPKPQTPTPRDVKSKQSFPKLTKNAPCACSLPQTWSVLLLFWTWHGNSLPKRSCETRI